MSMNTCALRISCLLFFPNVSSGANNETKQTRGSNKDYLFPVFVEGRHCTHVLLYTGEMFTVQKTLSHAVLTFVVLFFFSQVLSAH